jgi:uncharacterized membrane protein YgcG
MQQLLKQHPSHTDVLLCAVVAVVFRYFTHPEVHKLFKWDPSALTMNALQQLLKQQPSHICFLVCAACFFCNRYFTHQELHELFKWDPSALNISETQQLLKEQHKPSAELASISSHVSWLEAHALCAGTSEHGLLFSHQDPEGKHLQLDATHQGQHVPGSAAAAAAGLQRLGLGVSGYGRTGARAVAGAGAAGQSAAELSNMLSSLNIASRPGAGSGVGASAGGSGSSSRGGQGSAGSGGGSAANELQQQQQERQQRRDALQVEVQHLQYQLGRVTTDLATVGPRLPDGGSKVGIGE